MGRVARQAWGVSKASLVELEISPMRADELGFVASAWKQSYQDAPQNEAVPPAAYYARINRQFDALMARLAIKVLVARDAENRDTLLGFVCFEPTRDTLALHYTYVRRSNRRLGVASELLRSALGDLEPERLVYTAGTRFDPVWERWGFDRVELADWLRGAAA